MYMPTMGMYDQAMGVQIMAKGKGKLREEDFESAFAQAAAFMHQTESARIEEVTEERFSGLEDAMRNTTLNEEISGRDMTDKDQDGYGFNQYVYNSHILH
jgi:hypothetical protein